MLARLVEKSLVAVDDGGARAALPPARDGSPVRAGAARRGGRDGGARRRGTPRWALALAERERDSPLLEREAANLRAALDTLLARDPQDALRFCVALWPFWLRRIDLDEAQRRFAQALAAAPERTALRAEALSAAAAFDFRGGTLARGIARAEESYAIAAEIGDARAEWRALQMLGEFGIANERRDGRLGGLARARARAGAAGGLRGGGGARRLHARGRALGARRPRRRARS